MISEEYQHFTFRGRRLISTREELGSRAAQHRSEVRQEARWEIAGWRYPLRH